jgi:TrmH family RNA methyltransferase
MINSNSPNIIGVFSENSVFQHLEALKCSRTKRTQCREIFVEGVTPLRLAISNRWKIRSFIYPRDRQLSNWAVDILESGIAEQIIEVSPTLMEKLSDKEETSEIVAVVSMRKYSLSKLRRENAFTALVLDRASNPGNLGTIIRTCDAFGVRGVILSGRSVDPYDSRTIRASLGTVFSIPIISARSKDEMASWLTDLKYEHPDLVVIGTSSKADPTPDECDMCRPTVIIMGNETYGMSDFFRSVSDIVVGIPLCGGVGSLNVASAASIILYEQDRQRRNQKPK